MTGNPFDTVDLNQNPGINALAEDIIWELRFARSAQEVDRILLEKTALIAQIATQPYPLVAVRAIHIGNLADYRKAELRGSSS